jgi:calcineurin-like phosphoesterase family protein
MTVWFTADLHLGHANIIRYCNRPFTDVVKMNDALVGGWNEVVAPSDTVWVLGDVALGPIEQSLALVERLAGRKLLVAGNHDRCWSGHGRRARGWTERYRSAGFDEVHQDEVTIDVGGHPVTACHFPYRGDSHDEDRYLEHRPVDNGAWLLHGHVHDRWRQWGRMINVGVDVWSYRPVSAGTIGSLIAAGPGGASPLR